MFSKLRPEVTLSNGISSATPLPLFSDVTVLYCLLVTLTQSRNKFIPQRPRTWTTLLTGHLGCFPDFTRFTTIFSPTHHTSSVRVDRSRELDVSFTLNGFETQRSLRVLGPGQDSLVPVPGSRTTSSVISYTKSSDR